MRVLLIADWAPLEGGTERYVEALLEPLRSRGDEVALLTSSAGSAASGRARFVAHGSRTQAGRGVTQVVNPAAFLTVRRAVASFRPDIAHVNMFLSFLSPVALAGLGDVRSVVTLHDYQAICPIGWNVLPNGTACPHRPGVVCRQEGCIGRVRRLREAPRFALIGHALARVARVLSDSAWMESTLAAAGVRSERLALPVQPPVGAATPERSPHPLFVYGGRLEPEKGVDGLIRAFARLRRSHADAELRVCGGGGELPRLQQLAADLSCPVTFVPATPRWWRAASGAWAVVVPSLWEEPFGLVPIESITRGLPVIASDSGGLRESVRHGRTGLLYPRGDDAALAERLEAVATRRALAGPLPSEDVAALIARHDPDAHIARLREIYAEAAAT